MWLNQAERLNACVTLHLRLGAATAMANLSRTLPGKYLPSVPQPLVWGLRITPLRTGRNSEGFLHCPGARIV